MHSVGVGSGEGAQEEGHFLELSRQALAYIENIVSELLGKNIDDCDMPRNTHNISEPAH